MRYNVRSDFQVQYGCTSCLVFGVPWFLMNAAGSTRFIFPCSIGPVETSKVGFRHLENFADIRGTRGSITRPRSLQPPPAVRPVSLFFVRALNTLRQSALSFLAVTRHASDRPIATRFRKGIN